MSQTARMASVHLRDTAGRVHSAGDGVLALLAVFPLGGPAVTAVDLLGLRPLVRWLYQLVASRRGRLARFVRDFDPVVLPPRSWPPPR